MTSKSPDSAQSASAMRSAAIGLLTPSLMTLLKAPFDRIKILLQVQNQLVQTGRLPHRYNGIIDTFVTTYREEGLLAFWRGNLTNFFIRIPSFFIAIMARAALRPFFQSDVKKDGYAVWFLKTTLSGAVAGLISGIIMQPFTYAIVRLQADVISSAPNASARQFSGAFDVIKQTIRTDGFFALYRGLIPQVFCTLVYRGFYFGLYDAVRPFVDRKNIVQTFLLASVTTHLSALACYPLDTLAKRMMLSTVGSIEPTTPFHLLADIIKTEGVSSLWGGGLFMILRAIGSDAMSAAWDRLSTIVIKGHQSE